VTILPRVALRLTATADDLPQLEQALSEMEPNGTERTTVTSTYYDTAAGGLDRVGLALQVQKQNGQYKQIVTTAELKEQPPLTLCEWEDFIGGERPDLGAPNSSVHLPKALNEAELQARFATVVQRTACTLEPDASTEIVGALDKGEIRTVEGEHTEPLYEVELQLKRGTPAALYGTGLRLLEIAPLRIELRSKSERGCRLLESSTGEPQAQHSLPLGLSPT
jgi:inorganic triphosphatase YgiF